MILRNHPIKRSISFIKNLVSKKNVITYLTYFSILFLVTLIFTQSLVAQILVPKCSYDPNCSNEFNNSTCLIIGNKDNKSPLEPSGLIWVPELKVAIGISDERSVAPGYEIFWFDPTKSTTSENTILVTPLLTKEQSDQFQLDDLEGITRINGEFYVIGSLSLDKDEKDDESRWTRHQAIKFRINKDIVDPFYFLKIERVSGNVRPDLREWVISSTNADWNNNIYKKRAEKNTLISKPDVFPEIYNGFNGGINIEGLATTKDNELVMGFRGPIRLKGNKISTPVLVFSSKGLNSEPKFIRWEQINLKMKPQNGTDWPPCSKEIECERGIRGIDRIPGGTNEFIVILGHTGEEHHDLRLIKWNMDNGEVKDLGKLPKCFVGEGIAIMEKINDTKLKLLIVSDKGARFMMKDVSW